MFIALRQVTEVCPKVGEITQNVGTVQGFALTIHCPPLRLLQAAVQSRVFRRGTFKSIVRVLLMFLGCHKCEVEHGLKMVTKPRDSLLYWNLRFVSLHKALNWLHHSPVQSFCAPLRAHLAYRWDGNFSFIYFLLLLSWLNTPGIHPSFDVVASRTTFRTLRTHCQTCSVGTTELSGGVQ